jgi:hypothetical protein
MKTTPKSVRAMLLAGDAATIARERIADAAAQADLEGRTELSEALHSLWHTFSTAAMVIGELAEEELNPAED